MHPTLGKTCLATACLASALLLSGQSECNSVECDEPAVEQSVTEANASGSFGVDYFGQSFLVDQDGQLTAISVQISTEGSGELHLYSGGIDGITPAGTVIFSQPVSWLSSEAGEFQTFTLDIPLDVLAGDTFTWQLISSDWIGGYVCVDNCYEGGRALSSSDYDHGFQTVISACH